MVQVLNRNLRHVRLTGSPRGPSGPIEPLGPGSPGSPYKQVRDHIYINKYILNALVMIKSDKE